MVWCLRGEKKTAAARIPISPYIHCLVNRRRGVDGAKGQKAKASPRMTRFSNMVQGGLGGRDAPMKPVLERRHKLGCERQSRRVEAIPSTSARHESARGRRIDRSSRDGERRSAKDTALGTDRRRFAAAPGHRTGGVRTFTDSLG